jgi:hypothetical protein
MWNYCEDCGNEFHADEEWKTICKPCYRKRKQAEEGTTHTHYGKVEPVVELFEPEMLAMLIRLCHPDKHENSKMANTATQWLLSKRK